MQTSNAWVIPYLHISDAQFIEQLEQDPVIQEIRDRHFPWNDVEADSEEGQALLGKVATGQAHFDDTKLYNREGQLTMANGERPSDWLLGTHTHEVVPVNVTESEDAFVLSDSLQGRLTRTDLNEFIENLYADNKEPVMQEEPTGNLELTDELANNTGMGSDRSRLAYMLSMLRDDLFSHRRLGTPMFTEEQELEVCIDYPDHITAYVHINHLGLVTLLNTMYKDPITREEAYATVENLGFSMWSPQGEDSVYLNIDNQTVKLK